jgi:hypothetical protein
MIGSQARALSFDQCADRRIGGLERRLRAGSGASADANEREHGEETAKSSQSRRRIAPGLSRAHIVPRSVQLGAGRLAHREYDRALAAAKKTGGRDRRDRRSIVAG